VNCLRQLDALPGSGAAVRRLVRSTAEHCGKIDELNRRLVEVPVTLVDAGTASDFRYMAELTKKVVVDVTRHRRAILQDYSGREVAPAVVKLFQLLHLKLPKTVHAATHVAPHPTTREELERELGRRIISPVSEQERG